MNEGTRAGIRTGGDADLAFAVVVLASYFATFSSMQEAKPLEIIIMITLGTAYLGLGIYGYGYCIRKGSTYHSWLYFALQIPLGGMIVYLGKGVGFNAMVLFPLAGHAVVLLPRRFSYGMNLVIALIYVLSVYAFSQSFQLVWEGLPTFLAGIIFIIVFTQMALAEEKSKREVERLVSELTLANQRLREYSQQVEDLATVKERNRMAREIHDGLGHYLTTINMQLNAARAISPSNPAQSAEMLAKAQLLTQDALRDVRQSVTALRATNEKRTVLPEMIKNLIDQLDPLPFEIELLIIGQVRGIQDPVQWALYRTVQEGINNARKHANANHVIVQLDYESKDKIKLSVEDDGIGALDIQHGFGLTGIKERIDQLGGDFIIETASESGFRLEASVPG